MCALNIDSNKNVTQDCEVYKSYCPVTLGGISVHALIDSGNVVHNACDAAFARAVLKTNNLAPYLEPLRVTIGTAQKGAKMNVLGVLKRAIPLDFGHGTSVLKTRPVVIESLHTGVNLAGPFLAKHKIDQLHSQNALRVQGTIIPLRSGGYRPSQLRNIYALGGRAVETSSIKANGIVKANGLSAELRRKLVALGKRLRENAEANEVNKQRESRALQILRSFAQNKIRYGNESKSLDARMRGSTDGLKTCMQGATKGNINSGNGTELAAKTSNPRSQKETLFSATMGSGQERSPPPSDKCFPTTTATGATRKSLHMTPTTKTDGQGKGPSENPKEGLHTEKEAQGSSQRTKESLERLTTAERSGDQRKSLHTHMASLAEEDIQEKGHSEVLKEGLHMEAENKRNSHEISLTGGKTGRGDNSGGKSGRGDNSGGKGGEATILAGLAVFFRT